MNASSNYDVPEGKRLQLGIKHYVISTLDDRGQCYTRNYTTTKTLTINFPYHIEKINERKQKTTLQIMLFSH